MKVKKCTRKVCRIYAIEVVSEGSDSSLKKHLVISKFKDVFPPELPRLPLAREIDFITTLKLGAVTISKTTYWMTSSKLNESSIQVTELLD
jgi:hypothetical protein